MLSRGDAVVYKCRGVYKVEEVGKLDFSFVDGKKDYYTLQSIRRSFRLMMRRTSVVR